MSGRGAGRGAAARARRVVLAILVLGAATLSPAAARAHDQPYSHLEIRVEPGTLTGTLDAHVVDLARAAGIAAADSLLDPGFAARHAGDLERVLAARLVLRADQRRLEPAWTALGRVPGRPLLAFAWRAPMPAAPGRITVEGPLFTDDPQHETFVNVSEHGRLEAEEILDAGRRRVDYYPGTPRGTLAVVATFVAAGMHHIFIGPDHILFVVALLLLGGGVRRLIKIVTAFTLAHSVTLALAALDLVRPSPRLIEPAIALSIVLVGLENLAALRGRGAPGAAGSGIGGRDLRVALAFSFGLVHGFGFAGVLRTFGLPRHALAASLLSFNVGVELGQACIVLAVTPLLALARARDPVLARRLVWAGSALVIAAGSYWLVQRLVQPA